MSLVSRDTRIGVLMGGESSEREISLKTGTAIAQALESDGYNICRIDATRNLPEVLIREKIEIALIALHGPIGEDGCVQGLLEVMAIPYTGSGVLACSVAMDKRVTKELLDYHSIPTPKWKEATISDDGSYLDNLDFDLKYPVVVKPVAEGSTIGIHIVSSKDLLQEAMVDTALYSKRVLVEEYIPGREVTVGIINKMVLPVAEIIPKSGFFDFTSKYTVGKTDYIIPSELPVDVSEKCQKLALDTYLALGCEGIARVDIRINPDNECFVLEINTTPGMTETSLIPKAANYIGIKFIDICKLLLDSASLKVFRPKSSLRYI